MFNSIQSEIQNNITLWQNAFSNGINGKYTAGLVFIVVFCFLYTAKALMALRVSLQKEAPSKKFFETLVDQFDFWTVIALDLYYSFQFLSIDKSNSYLHWLLQTKTLINIFVIFRLASMAQAIGYAGLVWFIHYREKSTNLSDTEISRKLGVMPFLNRILIGLVALLAIFQILGLNVTALATSFGIGSIVVAFALQNVLSELFASFSVYLDKPFEIGDTVSYSDETGTVIKIGWRSTRIRTLQGESLVVPNKKLASEIIHNFNNLTVRRVSTDLGLHATTSIEQIQSLIEKIKLSADSINNFRFERATLKSIELGKIVLEIVYFVDAKEYKKFMEIKEEFNFLLLKAIQELEIKQAGIA